MEINLKIFKDYGRLDIGQSLVIQNEIVLGLEAAEGTDNLIIRCKDLKKNGIKTEEFAEVLDNFHLFLKKCKLRQKLATIFSYHT